MHTMHVCIFSLSFSLSFMLTHRNSFMFYSLFLHEVHAIPKQNDHDVGFFFVSSMRHKLMTKKRTRGLAQTWIH